MGRKKLPDAERCITEGCYQPRTPRSRICYRCQHAQRKASNPIGYCYGVWRRNARRRGIPFTITLRYFEKFCYTTDYIYNKGKSALAFTIDRIKNSKGYVPGNIRSITNSENASKGARKVVYHHESRSFRVVYKKAANRIDGPF